MPEPGSKPQVDQRPAPRHRSHSPAQQKPPAHRPNINHHNIHQNTTPKSPLNHTHHAHPRNTCQHRGKTKQHERTTRCVFTETPPPKQLRPMGEPSCSTTLRMHQHALRQLQQGNHIQETQPHSNPYPWVSNKSTPSTTFTQHSFQLPASTLEAHSQAPSTAPEAHSQAPEAPSITPIFPQAPP